MGAKTKLNAAYLHGALLVAGLAGLATGSPATFAAVLAGLLIASILAGDIRR